MSSPVTTVTSHIYVFKTSCSPFFFFSFVVFLLIFFSPFSFSGSCHYLPRWDTVSCPMFTRFLPVQVCVCVCVCMHLRVCVCLHVWVYTRVWDRHVQAESHKFSLEVLRVEPACSSSPDTDVCTCWSFCVCVCVCVCVCFVCSDWRFHDSKNSY